MIKRAAEQELRTDFERLKGRLEAGDDVTAAASTPVTNR
jgi:hypothetical protein